MDTTLEEVVADAKREREIIAQNLLRCINALIACAWRAPVAFYAKLGPSAASEASTHREMIEALKAVAPERVAEIIWPPCEVVYLSDGSAVPTTVPFDPARDPLLAMDVSGASALAASLDGTLMS